MSTTPFKKVEKVINKVYGYSPINETQCKRKSEIDKENSMNSVKKQISAGKKHSFVYQEVKEEQN